MKRICSHLSMNSPGKICRRQVIETNDQNIVTRLIDLHAETVETAHTLFYDGIISNSIVSLSERNVKKIPDNYHVITFDLGMQKKNSFVAGKTIIDFKTEDPRLINQIISNHQDFFKFIPAFELINACCYLPAEQAAIPHEITVGQKVDLILWNGIDLPTLQVKKSFTISKV